MNDEKPSNPTLEPRLADLRETAREMVDAAEQQPPRSGLSNYQRRRLIHLLRLCGAALGSVLGTSLLIWAMVWSLGDVEPSGPPGTISGRVTNFAGVSITNVTVQVEGTRYTASSDTTGGFTISGVPAGHRELVVTLNGVSGMSLPVQVIANKTVNVGTLELYTP